MDYLDKVFIFDNAINNYYQYIKKLRIATIKIIQRICNADFLNCFIIQYVDTDLSRMRLSLMTLSVDNTEPFHH